MAPRSMNGVLAVLAQIKFIVTLTTFLLILYTRSIHVVYFVLGACLTAILGKVLKRIWRHSRPHGRPGYGMPSTHSQVIMFFATYFHCVAYATMPGLVGCVSLLALAVVWSRVTLKYHSLPQVMVGVLIGTVCALLWHTAWSVVISPIIVDYTHLPSFIVL